MMRDFEQEKILWRVATFAAGLAWLVTEAGNIPDWDIPISILMAGTTALVMSRFDKALWRDKDFFLAFLIGNFPVDTVYFLYWAVCKKSPEVLIAENFGASWGLFLGCWLVWCALPRLAESIYYSRKTLFHFFK